MYRFSDAGSTMRATRVTDLHRVVEPQCYCSKGLVAKCVSSFRTYDTATTSS